MLKLGKGILALIPAAAAGMSALSGCKSNSNASLTACVIQLDCSGVRVKAGSQDLTAGQIRAVLESTSLGKGRRLTKSLEVIPVPGQQEHIYIVGQVGRRDELFLVHGYRNKTGVGFLLGSLVLKLLKIKELNERPGLRTTGELFEALAPDFEEVANQAREAGIARLETVGTNAVPIEQYSDFYKTLGELNKDVPIMRMRR
jgi:hypothetical protein